MQISSNDNSLAARSVVQHASPSLWERGRGVRLLFTIAVIALMANMATANAKIWRVNNNPGKSGV